MQRKHTEKRLIYLPGRYLLIMTSLVMLLFASEVSANASAGDVHEMAALCMQANRILKDYALVGMGVDYHDPKKDLEENLKIMDQELKDLEAHKLDDKLAAEVLEIEKSWNELKPEFEKKPEKTKMVELRKKVEAYTGRCEEVAEDISKDTGIKGEHDVVLVAELGMESQRLAALYMMKVWGVADSDCEAEVKEIVDQTEKIYKDLLEEKDEKLVSKEIKEKLKKVEKQFIAFSVMATSDSGRFMPSAAEKMATEIFEELKSVLDMEQTLVEGNVSYFIPIADEKSAGEIFRALTGIVHVNGEVKS